MKIKPIRECGGGHHGSLNVSYDTIVAVLGEPNCTDLDDPEKVRASWGFEDERGRQGFIWCYKYYGPLEACTRWSTDGDMGLLDELFSGID